MTPQEMADLLKNYGTQQRTVEKQIVHRLYNVVIRDGNHSIVEIEELVSLRKAREIKNEAHANGCTADILEDWTIDCNDREINPKPIICSPIPAPRVTAMNTPRIPEKKGQLRTQQNMAKAQDKFSRSHKNVESEFHMFRIVNKVLEIDIQDTEAKIAEYLDGRKDIKDFKIIYCGIATSWGVDA